MSSTNRGGEREVSDYYRTPTWAIDEFLKAFIALHPEIVGKTVLDPCAGGDAESAPRYPEVLALNGFDKVWGTDIRADSPCNVPNQDYLTYETPWKPDLIITNPPFVLAQEIITKALLDVADNGFVVMLLRLNYFGTQERIPFWRRQMPIQTFVHSNRMKFNETIKGTDSCEYMHCVWQKNNLPTHTQLFIIGEPGTKKKKKKK